MALLVFMSGKHPMCKNWVMSCWHSYLSRVRRKWFTPFIPLFLSIFVTCVSFVTVHDSGGQMVKQTDWQKCQSTHDALHSIQHCSWTLFMIVLDNRTQHITNLQRRPMDIFFLEPSCPVTRQPYYFQRWQMARGPKTQQFTQLEALQTSNRKIDSPGGTESIWNTKSKL